MAVTEYGLWPKKIITGPGSIDKIGAEVAALGGKKIIFFSDSFLSTTDMVKKPIEKLTADGFEVVLFGDIEANPTEDMVMAGVELMKSFRPDAIVVIGGGSPLDCAKAVNVVYTHGDHVSKYNVNLGGSRFIEDKLLPMIAVPTTAGTGSEVTAVGVITGSKTHIKYGIAHPLLIPDIAILDANLTLGLPPRTTANTGIDALTHLIEAYVSKVNSPFADGMCIKGMKMILEALPRAYKDGNDIEARDIMIQASCIAGIAFTINGLGLCHQMAHQLSGYFNTAHGLANAMLIPHVMRFNRKAQPQKFADIAEALGVDVRGLSVEEAGLKGIEKVEELCRSLGVPEYLDEIGIDKARVHDMAITALQDGVGMNNPIKTTVEECEALYLECFKN